MEPWRQKKLMIDSDENHKGNCIEAKILKKTTDLIKKY